MNKNNHIASVIIPAYNEEKKLPLLLDSITKEEIFEIIVVCNGCTDSSYKIAQSYKGIIAINLKKGSKIGALNAGDNIASIFPRLYLDADIKVKLSDLKFMVSYMADNHLLAAGTQLKYNFEKSPLLIRWYYSVWTQLPYVKSEKNIGSGIYALSRDGRKRFNDFPNIISDDGFINELFDNHEKQKVPGVFIRLDVPNKLKDLIKIKARATYGYKELKRLGLSRSERSNSQKDFWHLLNSHKKLFFPVLLYIILQSMAKLYGQLALNFSRDTWLRDESSRD